MEHCCTTHTYTNNENTYCVQCMYIYTRLLLQVNITLPREAVGPTWDIDHTAEELLSLPESELTPDELHHKRRIIEADTSHPIIISSNHDVIDGMHRIAKTRYILKRGTIKAVVMPDKYMKKFKLSDVS